MQLTSFQKNCFLNKLVYLHLYFWISNTFPFTSIDACLKLLQKPHQDIYQVPFMYHPILLRALNITDPVNFENGSLPFTFLYHLPCVTLVIILLNKAERALFSFLMYSFFPSLLPPTISVWMPFAASASWRIFAPESYWVYGVYILHTYYALSHTPLLGTFVI